MLALGPARFDPDSLSARDPALISRLLPIAHAFASRYLRARFDGFERHVSAQVPALYVANHNGGIAGPDIACTLSALWTSLGPSTPLYALTHDFAMRHSAKIGLGVFGRTVQKLGSVRASPSNAARALAAGGHVLVYPGGDLDAYRHWRRRDQIVLGERTGFVRLAQRARVPIVPIVAHGAHRSAFIFAEGERIARALRLKTWARLERFPIALALPWGIALGPWLPYLPLPFSIRLRALPPMHVRDGDDPAQARERVRTAMQVALDEMRAEARAR